MIDLTGKAVMFLLIHFIDNRLKMIAHMFRFFDRAGKADRALKLFTVTFFGAVAQSIITANDLCRIIDREFVFIRNRILHRLADMAFGHIQNNNTVIG